MSIIRELGNSHADFADMPVWGRLIVILGLAAFVLVFVNLWLMEHSIAASAPSIPVPATGETYRVFVKGERYVTEEQWEELEFWNSKTRYACIAFFVAFVVLFAYRSRNADDRLSRK